MLCQTPVTGLTAVKRFFRVDVSKLVHHLNDPCFVLDSLSDPRISALVAEEDKRDFHPRTAQLWRNALHHYSKLMAPALEARHAVIQQKFGDAIQLRELKSALHSVVDLPDQPLEFIKDPCRVAQIKAATTAANALRVEVNGFTTKQCSAHYWAGFLASSLSPPKHLLNIASVLAW